MVFGVACRNSDPQHLDRVGRQSRTVYVVGCLNLMTHGGHLTAMTTCPGPGLIVSREPQGGLGFSSPSLRVSGQSLTPLGQDIKVLPADGLDLTWIDGSYDCERSITRLQRVVVPKVEC